jgi:hypothetical protein
MAKDIRKVRYVVISQENPAEYSPRINRDLETDLFNDVMNLLKGERLPDQTTWQARAPDDPRSKATWLPEFLYHRRCLGELPVALDGEVTFQQGRLPLRLVLNAAFDDPGIREADRIDHKYYWHVYSIAATGYGAKPIQRGILIIE